MVFDATVNRDRDNVTASRTLQSVSPNPGDALPELPNSRRQEARRRNALGQARPTRVGLVANATPFRRARTRRNSHVA